MYDTLITGGHLLTMQGDGAGFVRDGAIAIEGKTIVAVGPRSEIEGEAKEVIDATDRLGDAGVGRCSHALVGGPRPGLGAGGRDVDG